MPSLGQLLAAHSPILLLDAASTRTQVGWFPSGELHTARWATTDEEAGIGIFRGIDQLAVDPGAACAFVFCDGPGSTLGVRSTAMALRVWGVLAPRPIFAFHSLAVIAAAIGRDDTTVIADARRDLWHTSRLGGSLRRVPAMELTGTLVTPESFRHWSPLPAGVDRVPYSLVHLLPRVAAVDLFRPVSSPDAFLHEEPNYLTWTPHIHRAPK